MNSRRYKTLVAVFRQPPPANLQWRAIESLLLNLGFIIEQSRGSAISFVRNDAIFTTHRPHRRNELLREQVKDLKQFLEGIGITP